MANLVHKSTGHSRPIKSSPSKDKPYYTVICNDGKLENIEEFKLENTTASTPLKHLIKEVLVAENGRPLKSKSYCGIIIYENNSITKENASLYNKCCKNCSNAISRESSNGATG